MEGARPRLGEITVNLFNINAENGSTVSAPFVSGNNIGGGVSNSTAFSLPTLREPNLHRKANSENDSAGPARKRARMEVHGYVHYISELKAMSRRASKEQKYFTARLQRKRGHVKVLIFDQKSYPAFCDAHTKRQPVSLDNISFKDSQQHVIFNLSSRLSCMQSVDFENDSKSCEPTLVGSISEARQTSAGEWITITGKITEQWTRRDPDHKGKLQPLKYSLVDSSGSISLILWENKWNINPGSWYTISHVEVDQYRGQNQFTFTQYTQLTEVPAQEEVVDLLSRHSFKVLGASVKNCHSCSICKAELPLIDPHQISVECPVCKDRVLVQSFTSTTKATVTVETRRTATKFPIPQSCMKPLLGLERPGFCDTEQAENKLLQMKMVEVVFRNNKVVEIKPTTEDGHD